MFKDMRFLWIVIVVSVGFLCEYRLISEPSKGAVISVPSQPAYNIQQEQKAEKEQAQKWKMAGPLLRELINKYGEDIPNWPCSPEVKESIDRISDVISNEADSVQNGQETLGQAQTEMAGRAHQEEARFVDLIKAGGCN